jgi:hypothetical protein
VLPTQPIDLFDDLGVVAFTTTRAAGTFGLSGDAPVGEVMERWRRLRAQLPAGAHRLATARQVHGSLVVTHDRCWDGWLHHDAADGHVAPDRGLALAVTIADCVPVFIAHPSGAVALLHSGWRGTEARIVERGISALAALGHRAAELRLALGPAICVRAPHRSSGRETNARRSPCVDRGSRQRSRRAHHLGEPRVHSLPQRSVFLAPCGRLGTADRSDAISGRGARLA